MKRNKLFYQVLSLCLLVFLTTNLGIAQVDIELSLEAEKPFLAENEQGKFTFTIANTGTADAADVVVVFTLPAVEFVGRDATSSAYFAEIKAGESEIFEIELISRVPSLQFYAEIVNGAGGDPDSNESNIERCRFSSDCPDGAEACIYGCPLEDDEVVYPAAADLEILAVSCPVQFPVEGDELTYEITVQNSSSTPSSPTVLSMFQYIRAVYTAIDPPRHKVSEATIPSIAAGTTQSVSLTYTYTPYQETDFNVIGNTFFSFDSNGMTEDAEVDIACQKITSDVALNMIANPATFGDDEIMNYQLEVTNNGTELVRELQVLYASEMGGFQNSFEGKVLTATTDFEASSLSQRNNLNAGTSSKYWDISRLEVGETAILNVSYQISGDIVEEFLTSYTINTRVSSDFLNDTDESNNQASLDFSRVAEDFLDLELSVTASRPDISRWERGSFTLTLENKGTIDATGVIVDICYNASMVGVGGAVPILSSGDFKHTVDVICIQAGEWTNVNVLAGETANLTIELFGTSSTPSLCAEVIAMDQEKDIDSTPYNVGCSGAFEDDEDDFHAAAPYVDMELSMEANNTPLLVNEDNTLVLYVKNNSQGIAHNVVTAVELSDAALTAGLSPIVSQGSYDAATGIWTLGDVFPYVTARLELHVVASNALANAYAQVIATDETDEDSTPNNGTCCTENEDDEVSLLNGGNLMPTIRYSSQRGIQISPNPTTDLLQLKGNYTAEMPYVIYDMLGKSIQSGQLANGRLEVQTLANGTYYLAIQDAKRSTIRFIKL